jgi:serine/threonine-protein kinase
LYSIGVVLYEMLTGRVPFDAESAVTIALKHVSEAPPPMSVINRDVPPELEQVVMWALNKNPVDRPANADQFITALEQARTAIQSGERGQRTASMPALAGVAAGRYAAAAAAVSAPPAAPPPPGTGSFEVTDAVFEPLPEEEPPHRRPLWPWVLLLILLLLAGGGVAAYLLTRPVKQVVPAVVGESFTTAQAQLQNDGFTVSQLQETNAKAAGTVIGQNPLAGAKAKEGSNVSLTVSSGPGNTTVPTVVGETLQQAKSSIEIANLKVGKVQHQTNAQYAKGQVIDTSPSAGATPPVGTPVTIFVSSGPPPVSVPDVTGEDAGQAKATLQSRGFNVSTSEQVTTTATPNSVLSQNPPGGKSAPSGSTVSLVVAKAPPTVAVPNVVGQTTGSADATLGAAGFPAVAQPQTVSTQSQNGIVLSQNPAAGSQAKRGTSITIVVGKYVAPTPTPTTTTTTPTTTTTTTGTTSTPKKKK